MTPKLENLLAENKLDLNLITVRISSRAKRLIYKTSVRKGIEIVIPKNANSERVLEITQNKIPWISNAQKKINDQRHQLTPKHIELKGLGEKWSVNYRIGAKRRILIDGNSLTLGFDQEDIFYSVIQLQNWFNDKAKESLIPWITSLAEKRKLKFNRVFIKNQVSLWGSCSEKRNINLNRNLLFISPDLIEYVLHHELTHLEHMNHSKQFWTAFSNVLPEYQELRSKIRSVDPQEIPLWAERI